MELVFEELTRANYYMARLIDRTDIPEEFVDGVPTLIQTLEYGFEHGCIGHAFAVSLDGRCIATILLGEALEWKTDPPEVKQRPFYRLMSFVVDRHYRDRGIGGEILEKTISMTCADFGVRPIVTGVHRDNAEAVRFYERHGFTPTPYMEGNDCYYLRYPHE